MATWQKVVAVIGVLVLLLVLILVVGGGHTPRPHGVSAPTVAGVASQATP